MEITSPARLAPRADLEKRRSLKPHSYLRDTTLANRRDAHPDANGDQTGRRTHHWRARRGKLLSLYEPDVRVLVICNASGELEFGNTLIISEKIAV